MTNTRVIDLKWAWAHVPHIVDEFGTTYNRWKAEWVNSKNIYNSKSFKTREAARSFLRKYR